MIDGRKQAPHAQSMAKLTHEQIKDRLTQNEGKSLLSDVIEHFANEHRLTDDIVLKIIEETPGGIRVELNAPGQPKLVLDSDDYVPPIPFCPLCRLRALLTDYAGTSNLLACVRSHKFHLGLDGTTRTLECKSSPDASDKGKRFVEAGNRWVPAKP